MSDQTHWMILFLAADQEIDNFSIDDISNYKS